MVRNGVKITKRQQIENLTDELARAKGAQWVLLCCGFMLGYLVGRGGEDH